MSAKRAAETAPETAPEPELKLKKAEVASASASASASAADDLGDKIAAAAEHLKVHGWAVVPGVVDAATCDRARAEMWDWVERTTQHRVKRSAPATCSAKNWVPNSHYIVQQYAIGHSPAAWIARRDKGVQRVFAELWGTDKLTVSFDGANLRPAPENVPGQAWPKAHTWLHKDQSVYRDGLECIQGFVTYEDVDGDEDATLMVIPGSHLTHAELTQKHRIRPAHRATFKPDNGDWFKFTPAQLAKIYGEDWKAKTHRVSAPKGSVVLWDSRATHQGCEPVEGRAHARDRALAYVCFGPEALMTENERKKKRDAATNNRTTSHWPWKSKLFGLSPRTYGAVLPDFDVQTGGRDDNDPDVAKLCCFRPYGAGATGLLGWDADREPLLDFVQLAA